MEVCCGCLVNLLFAQTAPPLHKAIADRDVEGVRAVLRTVRRGSSAGRASPRLVEGLLAAAKTGDPNVVIGGPTLPLHEAVRCQLGSIVENLLHAKACADRIDHQGMKAIEIAAASRNPGIVALLRKEKDNEENEQFEETLSWLSSVPVFRRLELSEYPRLAAAFTSKQYAKGDVVIRVGEIGDRLYFIQTGRVEVYKMASGKQALHATLGPGDFFGEGSLLNDVPRSSTVQVIEYMEVKVLTRADFNQLELRKKLVLKRKALRQGDQAHSPTASPNGADLVKTREEFELVREAMLQNQFLGPLVKSLGRSALDGMVHESFSKQVDAGAEVIRQGALKADHFYIVQEGKLDIILDGKKIATLGPGCSFGEKGLLFRHPRTATVKAASPCKLWLLSRQALREVLQAPLRRKVDEFSLVLEHVDIFRGCSAEDRRQIAEGLVEKEYRRDQYIMRQGDHPDYFFILQEGAVAIEVDGKVKRQLREGCSSPSPCCASPLSMESPRGSSPWASVDRKCSIHTYGSNHFGEHALLHNEPRSTSVRVESDTVRILALHRDLFLAVRWHSTADTRERADTMESVVSLPTLTPRYAQVQYEYDKLRTLGVLGSGGFGKVTLVECGVTGQTFALKAISKGHLCEMESKKSVVNEKNILRMTSSPFVVRLAATFNGRQHLYFLMEAALGGELFTVYENRQLWGSETHARFYSACVVLAFEHLHQRHIAYRDLKPENLLLDQRGYCKVTDFGLSKFSIGHSYTTCGTPDYFAPEMVLGAGHTVAVDWWALGILVYELILGQTPFADEEVMVIFGRVKQGIECARFPGDNPCWAQFVRELCQQAPHDRLPMRPGGVSNIQEALWYQEVAFNWDALVARSMQAPYVPEVKGATDLSNFAGDEAEEPDFVEYVDDGSGWDQDFENRMGPTFLE